MCCGGKEDDKYEGKDLSDPTYEGEPVNKELK
jgi:hypothetical protein